MHIALITTEYPPDTGWGGIASYVYHMARGFASLGQRVTIVCGFSGCPTDSAEGNIRILRCLDLTRNRGDSIALQVLEELGGIVCSEGVDIVEFPEFTGIGAAFQRMYPEVPCVVKLHGDSELCRLGGAARLKRVLLRFDLRRQTRITAANEKESVGRAHAVVSPSAWLLGECVRRRWTLPRIRRIVANPFSSWPDADFSVDYGTRRVLWLGRLSRRKGIDLFPGIAKRVWREVPDAEIHLIGQDTAGGGWTSWIQRQLSARANSSLKIHQGVPYLALPSLLQQHSVAVFASTWENFPYSHLECMWAGMACVCASGGGAKELGHDGQTMLFARRDPAEIASRVVALLRSPELRERIGRSAKDHVRRNFAAQPIAAEMLGVYQSAIASSRVTKQVVSNA